MSRERNTRRDPFNRQEALSPVQSMSADPPAGADVLDREDRLKVRVVDAAESTADDLQPEIAARVAVGASEEARDRAQQAASYVIVALEREGIADPDVIAYAMATIEHETGGAFGPVDEGRVSQKSHPELYKLQNKYSGGWRYHGRGYIQLTHDYNYQDFGKRVGLGDKLLNNPALAKDPEVAAQLLAAFFKDRGVAKAVQEGDLNRARRLVNGWRMFGLSRVNDAYDRYRSKLTSNQIMS